MKNYLKYIFPFLSAILLAGCIAEDDFGEKSGATTGEEAQVRITLQMPSASVPRTRAISEIDENHVATIDVLAFRRVPVDEQHPSGWSFAYKAKGTSIADQPGDNPIRAKKQFTVTLIKDKDNEQTLVFIANVNNYPISKGEDKDKALKKLIAENAGSWNANNDNTSQEGDNDRFLPFPMWGETKATINDATTTITGVSLLRAIARFDVALKETVANFKLDEIYVYNSKNKGHVVPDPVNLTDGKVKAATVPAGEETNNAFPLKYVVPAGMERLFERTMYLFEAQAVAQDQSSKATCLVIGGTFGQDTQPTYYRLDFFKKDTDNKPTGEYCDILRNHRYSTNIIKVSGRGYDTPEEAFNSKAINMICEIIDWDDNTTDTDFTGQYYLSVGSNPVNLFGEASTGNKLTVKTDYPTGWSASVPDAADNWITIQGSSTDELLFNVTSNMGGTDERRGIIQIKAGNLSKDITVVQKNFNEVDLEIVQNGNPLNSLFFASVDPNIQTYQVEWKPAGARCIRAVYNTKKGGLDFVPPVYLTNGGGSQTLLVNSIPDGVVNGDPFIEKETVITYTVVDDATGQSVSKSVILSQINYTLVATEYNNMPYVMDGTEKRFKIKSNLPWRVQEVSSPKIVQQFTQPTGEKNVYEHDFIFKIVNKQATQTLENATAQLRFSSTSTDENKKFNNDIQVNFNAINGLKFTYNGQTLITDFVDVNNGANVTRSTANSKCEAIVAFGKKWRLPTEPEFVDGRGNVFSTLSGSYWSSTNAGIFYRFVNMPGQSGESSGFGGLDSKKARCVYGPVK